MKRSVSLDVTKRRKELEKKLHLKLTSIGSIYTDEERASKRHCEQMIGIVQVPLGIAGPIVYKTIQSPFLSSYMLPLATTEGALVASVNRGCKAIRESGGAHVDTYHVGTTRGPVFAVKNVQESDLLNTFIETHIQEMQNIAKSTSDHIRLTNTVCSGVGKYRYVRFVFDTSDAMGLNMVTVATEKITEYIEQKTGISCIALSGNYCVDKKPSWLNVVEGRGYKVWAEILLSQHVLKTTLKTSAAQMFDVWMGKCMLGSAMSGSMGYNAHIANVLGALFLATGQDIAHLAECSVGITTAEIRGKELYVSIYLPDLMVGTIGGGTELATQKEALQILGIYGGENGKNKQKLVEIIGAAVLAGEISLLASLSEGSLARAHQRLARGKHI